MNLIEFIDNIIHFCKHLNYVSLIPYNLYGKCELYVEYMCKDLNKDVTYVIGPEGQVIRHVLGSSLKSWYWGPSP